MEVECIVLMRQRIVWLKSKLILSARANSTSTSVELGLSNTILLSSARYTLSRQRQWPRIYQSYGRWLV